jgi:hypothetical protein
VAEDLKTKVEIGGDTSGLTASFGEAAKIVREHAAQMAEGFKGAQESVESLTSKFTNLRDGILAVLGLQELNKLMTETASSTRNLALALGETPEKASVLKSELSAIGVSSETYVGALTHLARQMKTNEDGINAMGIATRNADGSTRDSQAVMQDALKAVQQYKPGLDQAQASMYLFGRSVDDVRALMPLLSQNAEEAAARTEALGLSIGGEQIAAVNRYKVALNEGKEVIEGVFTSIGQQLLPVLTDMQKAFNDAGPQIVAVAKVLGTDLGDGIRYVIEAGKEIWKTLTDAFAEIGKAIGTSGYAVAGWGESWKNALAIVKTVAEFLKGALKIAIDVVVGGIQNLITTFTTVGTVAGDLAHLDFSQAWKDASSGADQIEKNIKKTFDQVVLDTSDAGEAMGKAILSGYQKTAPKPKDLTDPLHIDTGDETFTDPKKSQDAAAGRDTVLRAQLAGENAVVKEYVSEQDKALQDGYKNGLIALKDYYAQRLALSQLQLDTEIATTERMQQSVAAQKALATSQGDDKGVQAALAQEATLQTQLIVLQQKRAAAAIESAAAQADAEKKLADQIALTHAQADEKVRTDALDAQHAIIAAEAAAGQITGADAIAAFRNIEKQKYDIAVEFATKRAALEQDQVKAQAELGDKLSVLRADYEKKDTEIAVQNIKQRKDFETQAITDIQNDFATALDDIETKHKSVFDAIKTMLTSLEAQFLKMANQELAQNLFGANPAAGSAGGAGGGGLLSGLLGKFGTAGGGSEAGGVAGSGLLGWLGSFDSGIGYVPKTGLAVLHPGERVLTRQENMEGGGDTLHVHNNFNVSGETTYESRAAIASQVGRTLQAARRNF